MEGPLHEAFLSPRKDRNPVRIEKAPPPPLSERPGIDPPSTSAEWIEGYWEWDAGRNDFVWVTGTWRVPPPGRFWVNGYWKRDDQGWYRVPGFWSERKTDRLDYRKNGPPQDRPDDEPGEPPSADCFYIPGQYYPDGDGVVWKKGLLDQGPAGLVVGARAVGPPARRLGLPGRLLGPDPRRSRNALRAGRGRQVARGADDLTYQPYTKVSPEMYGQLNGAFGRPNSNYDGYPGVYYDDSGRYYGYASYGYLNGYYGYLDYPYYGGYGYPYYATPVQYGMRRWLRLRRYGGYGGSTAAMATADCWAAASAMGSVAAMADIGGFGYRRLRLGYGYGWLRRLRRLGRLRRLWRLRWLRLRLRRLRVRRASASAVSASGSASGFGFGLRLWLPGLRVRLRIPLLASGSAALAGGWGCGLGRVGESLRIRQPECLDQPERQHQSDHQRHAQRQHDDAQYEHQPEREHQSIGQLVARGCVAGVVACVRAIRSHGARMPARRRTDRERGKARSAERRRCRRARTRGDRRITESIRIARPAAARRAAAVGTAAGAGQGQGSGRAVVSSASPVAATALSRGGMGQNMGAGNSAWHAAAMGNAGMGGNMGRMGASMPGWRAMGGHPGMAGRRWAGWNGGHPGRWAAACRWAADMAAAGSAEAADGRRLGAGHGRLPRRHGWRVPGRHGRRGTAAAAADIAEWRRDGGRPNRRWRRVDIAH